MPVETGYKLKLERAKLVNMVSVVCANVMVNIIWI